MNKSDAAFCLGRAVVESKSEQLHWALECEKALRGDIYEHAKQMRKAYDAEDAKMASIHLRNYSECSKPQSPAPVTAVHEHITATINAIEEGDATKARQHLRAYLAACSNDWKQLNNL